MAETTTSTTCCPDMPGVPSVPSWAGPTVTARSTKGSNRITVGASVKLWSEEGLAEDFGLHVVDIQGIIATLGLPILRLPGTDKRYVNLYALESALFSMTMPDALIKGEGPGRDVALLRLHQELAGTMYMASTKEAIRERVKRFAKMLGRGLTIGRKKAIIREQQSGCD